MRARVHSTVFTDRLSNWAMPLVFMPMAILLGAPAGYALARFRFRAAVPFRLLVLMTRAFPVAILALPLTVGFIRIGLYDTALGVALVRAHARALPLALARARAIVAVLLASGVPSSLVHLQAEAEGHGGAARLAD